MVITELFCYASKKNYHVHNHNTATIIML